MTGWPWHSSSWGLSLAALWWKVISGSSIGLRPRTRIDEEIKDWCRRGESEYSGLLKTRNLLIFRDVKSAEHGKIAPNWNVSGTRIFSSPANFMKFF
jgi:hypothetical protein